MSARMHRTPGIGRDVPIVHIHTDCPEIPTEHPTVDLLIAQIAHAPSAFMIHDNQRTSAWRFLCGRIHPDCDLRTISDCDLAILFVHLWNGPGYITEVVHLAETGRPVLTLCEVIVSAIVWV